MILSLSHYNYSPQIILIMKGSTKVALGVLGALAAGVTIGLLMAPEKGSDTRNRIKRRAEDWADQLRSKGKEVMEDVEERSKKIKSAAMDKINKVKESIG